jgi:hypothetical protein
MAETGKNIANLKLEINAAELKKIVASGNLNEFVENASDLAAQQIRSQIFEELGKLALNASEKGIDMNTGITVNMKFLMEGEKYGTRCVRGFCITRCRPFQESLAAEVAAGVIAGMTQYKKI